MPGYIRGFVEREFADQWEFVCRVDPFTGSQGSFKYVFFGTRAASALGPVVHTKGFPDDLAPSTKLAMLGRGGNGLDRLSGEDLHERFRSFRERLSDHTPPRHVSLERLRAFDWDRGIDDEARAELADGELERSPYRVLRLFELVDADGRDFEEWEEPTEEDDWRQELDRGETLEALLRGERVETDGKTVSLRPRSRREILPETWFELLELLSHDWAAGHRSVRFVFYWHH